MRNENKYKTKKYKQKASSVQVLGMTILLVSLLIEEMLKRGNIEAWERYEQSLGWIIAFGAFLTVADIFGKIVAKSLKNNRMLKSSMREVDGMSGTDFEDFCIAHFNRNGYRAYPTDASGDYGADIILEKHGRKTVVQCKRYKGKVGVEAVQQAVGAKGYYKASDAMVITNSFYTPNARKLAEANGVTLWDRNSLQKWV